MITIVTTHYYFKLSLINTFTEKAMNEAKLILPGIGSIDHLFFKHPNEVSLPTYKQKQEIKRLRDVGSVFFSRVTFRPLLDKIQSLCLELLPLQFMKKTEEGFDEDHSSPFWKLIGFSRNDPCWDFCQFQDEKIDNGANKLGPIAPYSLVNSSTESLSTRLRYVPPSSEEASADTFSAHKKDLISSIISQPIEGRWRGGRLTLENVIYFFVQHPLLAQNFLRKRLFHSNEVEDMNLKSDGYLYSYPLMLVSMEITRFIALLFEVITTSNLVVKNQDYLPGAPTMEWQCIKAENSSSEYDYKKVFAVRDDPRTTGVILKPQRNTLVQRDRIPRCDNINKSMFSWRTYWYIFCSFIFYFYALKSTITYLCLYLFIDIYIYIYMVIYRSFVTEENSLPRLFVCAMVIFETIFESNSCKYTDLEEVLEASCKYLEDFMVHSSNIGEVEAMVASDYSKIVHYFDQVDHPDATQEVSATTPDQILSSSSQELTDACKALAEENLPISTASNIINDGGEVDISAVDSHQPHPVDVVE